MLKGKCAIVTGAAKGIGKAIALKLASLGANIVLNYRSSEKEAAEVANEIKELGVENANVKVVDKGALNYALIARTKAAVYRAAESHDYKF